MAIGLGAKLARLLLLTFNLIFWLSGIGLIGVGIWLLVDQDRASIFAIVEQEGTMPMIQIAAYVILGIGCFVLLVGFLGCCGAMHENRCMLVTYFAVILLILLAELVAGILVVIYKGQLEEKLQLNMRDNLKRNYGSGDSSKLAVTSGFDFVQYTGSCCGVLEWGDYNSSAWRNNTGQQVPNSCCFGTMIEDTKQVRPVDSVACQSTDSANWNLRRHTAGCYEQVKTQIKSIDGILIGIGIGIGVLEILGMVFAICLCRNIDYDI